MFKNYQITLDTTRDVQTNPTLNVNTNDLNAFKISVTIMQHKQPIDLTGATARIAIKKPDNNTVFQDCTITDAENGKCEVILDTQAYVIQGKYSAEIMIYHEGDTVAVTSRFTYIATRGILDDGTIVSTNEWQSVNQAIADVEKLMLKIHAKDNRTMLLDSSDTSDWVKWYGYQMQADETNTKYSSVGIQIIDDSSGTAVRNNNIRPFSALKNNKTATLVVYVENAKDVSALEIYLADVTDYSGYQSFTFQNGRLCEGWNELTIDLSKLTTSGTGSLTNKKVSVQIRVQANAETTVKVTFDSLWVKKSSKPKVIFTFDDGWESQYTQAFPLFLERGFRASVGVISNKVGTTNYVTLDNLKEMYRYGWDLFNHTETHPDLSTLDSEQVVNEITNCKNYLLNNGFKGAEDILAYPYGGHNNLVVDALKPHIRYARTLIERSEAPIPLEPLRASTRNVVNLNPSVINGYIDDAINTGDTLVITAHIIDPVADTGMKYTPADLETILDHLYTNRDLVDVVTISEWVDTFPVK
jgi:peptidoglycan/xylan/chitin deacetylase (PgdA/CDA1 family)